MKSKSKGKGIAALRASKEAMMPAGGKLPMPFKKKGKGKR